MAEDILDFIDDDENDLDDTVDDMDDDDAMDNDEFEDEVVQAVNNDDEYALTYEMNAEQALEITEAIKSSVTATYILIAKAHQHKAYKALGYDTWAEYVRGQFDMSASRSYQLLNLSKTIEMLEEAAPEGTPIKLTEAQARDIKEQLPKITEQIKEATDGMSADDASAEVDRIIDDVRDQKRAEEKNAEREKANSDKDDEEERQSDIENAADMLLEADRSDDMTDNADDGLFDMNVEGSGEEHASGSENTMDVYNFFNLLKGAENLPEPEKMLTIIPSDREQEVDDYIGDLSSWINRFFTLWEERDEN